MKKKIGKKVWFNQILWDVVKVISPTKFDHFILIKRIRKDQVHSETKIHPVEMKLIDCHNDEFYPDTMPIRMIMNLLGEYREDKKKLKEKLQDIWMETVSEK